MRFLPEVCLSLIYISLNFDGDPYHLANLTLNVQNILLKDKIDEIRSKQRKEITTYEWHIRNYLYLKILHFF